MAGNLAYLLIVAVPAYLLAMFSPWAAYVWVGLLLVASIHRYLTNRADPTERKAFLYLSLPSYVFTAAMVALWF